MTTRAQMATRLELSPSSPTKTFVLEVHSSEPRALLGELVGGANVDETDDAYLFIARIPGGEMWVDQLDERFWSFHTDLPVKHASAFLAPLVETRRDLDWVWLPSGHLRNVWPNAVSRRVVTSFHGSGFLDAEAPAQDLRVQLSGRDADNLVDLISADPRYRSAISFDGVQASIADPDFGVVEEAVNRKGRFAVSGDSLELHLQFVQQVVARYSTLVRLCEQAAIMFAPFDGEQQDGGGHMTGTPVVVRFSREIKDLAAFAATLFSARHPFRLWGMPEIGPETVTVEAVDLHVGQTLSIHIGRDWLRVHLGAGSCGNTVARLIANLQHTFDGALYMQDPLFDAALRHGVIGPDGGRAVPA